MTRLDQDRIQEMALRGFSDNEIARELGYLQQSVTQARWRCGIPANFPAPYDKENVEPDAAVKKMAGKQKAYYEQHRDEIAGKKKAYYEQHRDEIAGKQKAYYEQHRDEIAGKQKAYYEQHRDEAKAYYEQHRDEIAAKCKAKAAARKAEREAVFLRVRGVA